MASKKKAAAKAVKAVPFNSADITKASAYIQRLIQDAELRDNVRQAYDSSKSAYDRLTNGKAPHKALLEDKKLQRDLQQAAGVRPFGVLDADLGQRLAGAVLGDPRPQHPRRAVRAVAGAAGRRRQP